MKLRNEGTAFALQAATPSRGSDELVKWSGLVPRSRRETLVLNALTFK